MAMICGRTVRIFMVDNLNNCFERRFFHFETKAKNFQNKRF